MSKEKAVLFTVAGFEVKPNTVYTIGDKKDGDAPDGFVKLGVTKLPSLGIDETFQPRFIRRDPNNPESGVWDTGFYEYSPCYDGQEHVAKAATVKALVKNLLEPYRAATGQPDAFELTNKDFFDKLMFRVYSGKMFNTADPVQAMELYFALLSYQVAPKGSEGDSKYRMAAYTIFDNKKKTKDKNETSLKIFKAIGLFNALYSSDREKLVTVLRWVGITLTEQLPDEDTLVGMFDQYLSGSYERAKIFLDTCEEANTETGLNKLNIYKRLKEVVNKGNKISKSPKGIYFYDGDIEIGPDLKSASENIAKNKDLNRVKKELLLLDEEEL
jgi:hypothetical protein